MAHTSFVHAKDATIFSSGVRLMMIPYDQFRTGLTYRDVYHMLWDRKWKRRHTVLGFWHQLKQQLYAAYVEETQAPF